MSPGTSRALALGLLCGACRQEMYEQPSCRPLAPSAVFSDGTSARPLVPGTVARGMARTDRLLYEGLAGGPAATPLGARTTRPGALASDGVRRAGLVPDPRAPALEQTLASLAAAPTEAQAAAAHVALGLAQVFPFAITHAVMERGRQEFDVFCSPCHDRLGTGSGMIVRRGFTAPPSFHLPRLRAEPVGHFFDVITNGFGAMPAYAAQVPPRDRWAIIAYIRALQLSRGAALTELPAEDRRRLEGTP